jgi:mitogen-activated protein kinase 7
VRELTGPFSKPIFNSSEAKVRATEAKCAIKRNIDVFEKDIYTKRALREVQYLNHFTGHENITSVIGISVGDAKDWKDMYYITNDSYLIEDYMETNLDKVCRGNDRLFPPNSH